MSTISRGDFPLMKDRSLLSWSSFFLPESDGGPQSHKLQKRRGSHLQDIEEVDEDLSSRGIGSIPPPLNVMLERQFVDEGQYTVAIKWEMPHPLPEGVTGYCVYVNGELHYEISEPDRTSVLLTGIPRKQVSQGVGWSREKYNFLKSVTLVGNKVHSFYILCCLSW